MTDPEFDVLNELYFVTGFADLMDVCDMERDDLLETIDLLYQKGWIKILTTVDDEINPAELDLKNNFASYYFLATKNGLLAHNRT